MRFTILPVGAVRHTTFPLGAEVIATKGISCVYLTSSSREAVRAWQLLGKFEIRMYWATTLKEALLLLKTVDASVLLVDESFPGGTWRDAILEVSNQRSETAVVVAAPMWHAPVWEDVIPSGGYDVVLKPLSLEEIGPVVESAANFAHEFLAKPTREARERAVLMAIRRGAGQPPESHCSQMSGIERFRLFRIGISKLFRAVQLFLTRSFRR